jgi:predicted phosphodiesterase
LGDSKKSDCKKSGDFPIILLGDVHGKFDTLLKYKVKEDQSYLQVGDLGVGFPRLPVPKLPSNFFYIRGNHDNPEFCKTHINYLGDFGYNLKLDLFWMGGAFSPDWELRTPGYDWWFSEELNVQQLNEALELYSRVRPRYVVTHECPECVRPTLFPKSSDLHSRTPHYLGEMLAIHQPEIWIFGHYHRSIIKKIGQTTFVCLNELSKFELPGLEW